MAAGQPLKLSESVLNEYYFSVKAEKDSFKLNKLKRDIIKILNSPEADLNDSYALAIIEYNLGNYDKSLRIISQLIKYQKEDFSKILAIAKITLVQNNLKFSESEESILDHYFKNSRGFKIPELSFSVFLNSISSISKRHFLKNRLRMDLTYYSKEDLHWEVGPFKNNEIIIPNKELNQPRDMGYLFESNLQILILNDEFTNDHRNFLLNFLSEEYLNNIISEYSARYLEEERDYSLFVPVEF